MQFIVGVLAGAVVAASLVLAWARRARASEREEWEQRLEHERQRTRLARMGIRSPVAIALLQGMREACQSAQKWEHQQGCGCHWCKEMAA